MKLNTMKEFIRLSQNKNFSKTASELYIAQSALSRHIVSLEEELGVQLIIRNKNTFQLTPEGKLVKEKFEIILDEYQDTLYQLSLMSKHESKEIHVGILYYDMAGYGAKIRETFHRLYPEVKLNLHSYQPEELEEKQFNGFLDIGILYSVEYCQRNDISHLPFLKIPFQCIVDRNHILAKKDEIAMKDLDNQSFLYPAVQFELCRTDLLFQALIQKYGIQVQSIIPVENYDEVPYLLKDTQAIFMSPMANTTIYGDMVKTYFPEPNHYRSDVSVVWLKSNKNSAINLFCNAVKICFPS